MDEFTKWVKELRKEFPPLLPVRVYRRNLSGKSYVGCCELTWSTTDKPERFVITIHKGSRMLMLNTLIHEWAHVYAWQEGAKTPSHGPQWGIAMSQIYQHMLEE